MSQRPLRVSLALVALALALTTTAAAVTGSTPDGDDHPYVGALLVDGAVACSAVLVAPAVAATAGHCGADGTRVVVSFESALGDEPGGHPGTIRVDSSKGADLAVVVLDAPAPVTPAALPQAGAAASLAKGVAVTSVGYGYSSRAADGSWVYDGLRRVAASPLQKVGKSMLTVSTRAAGPCMGDSGGPQLLEATVLSVTSTGSKDCTGSAAGYRLDTASARAFLAAFLTLP